MIVTNELLLQVIRLAKLPPKDGSDNFLLNPYRLPNRVTMSSNYVMYNICFELVQNRLKLQKWKGYTNELRDSMIAYATWALQHGWQHFNSEKSKTPISYFNVIIDSAFLSVICDSKYRQK